MEGFYKQRQGEIGKLKQWIISDKVTFLQGEGRRRSYQAADLTRVDQQFQTDWVKILFLGEAKIAIRLGIKSWWGLAKVTPFWAYCFFLTIPPL